MESTHTESFESRIADRYSLVLKEFQGKFYLHIKDTKLSITNKPRQVTLNVEGILALHKKFPRILNILETEQAENSDEDSREENSQEEEPAAKVKKIKF